MKWIAVVVVLLIAQTLCAEGEGYGFLGWKFGDLAYNLCKENPNFSKKPYKGLGLCDKLQEAIEDSFDFSGETLHPQFSYDDAYGQVEKRAFEPRWKKRAEVIIQDTIRWMLKEPQQAKSVERIKDIIGTSFFDWFSDVLKNEPERKLPEQIKKMFTQEQMDRFGLS